MDGARVDDSSPLFAVAIDSCSPFTSDTSEISEARFAAAMVHRSIQVAEAALIAIAAACRSISRGPDSREKEKMREVDW